MLRALRNANLSLQNQREISAGFVEKLLKLDRPVTERFYALYREQFNPDLTVPDAVVEECISVGTFRAKEKSRQAATGRGLDVCRKNPTLISKGKDLAPRGPDSTTRHSHQKTNDQIGEQIVTA